MKKRRLIIIAMPSTPLYEVLRYNLAKRLYAVSRAVNGEELIELAEEESPDLIIANAELGDMDAFAAISKIKIRHKALAPIPTVVISPNVDKQAIIRAAQLGISGYIAEPFDLEDVIAKVENLVGTVQVLETVALRGCSIIMFNGRVSYQHAKLIKTAIQVLLEAGHRKVIIDLSEADFLAHQVMVVLLSAQEKLKSIGGKLVICEPNAGIASMFAKAGLGSAIEIHPNRAQALSHV